MKRAHLKVVLPLFILPAALIGYRVIFLGYPLVPTIPGKAFKVTFEAALRGTPGQETSLRVALPGNQEGLSVAEEQSLSGILNFGILLDRETRWGVWSGQLVDSDELVSYGALIVPRSSPPQRPRPSDQGAYPEGTEPGERVLARKIAARWKSLEPPSRLKAVREALLGNLAPPEPSPEDLASWQDMLQRLGRPKAALILLQAAGLPARMVQGLRVLGGVETSTSRWLEVWTGGSSWEKMEPDSLAWIPPSVLTIALRKEEGPLVEVIQGEVSQVSWTVTRERLSGWRAYLERAKTSPHLLDRWSLFRLPEQFQETFRILLLVPLGALMICVLRNIVGFPTFGIFMPVLMALAFRSTGLAYGLVIFAGVALVGFLLRRSLEGLRLLLVPRLSVILTGVILMFTMVALLGNRLGQREMMAVGLIPFVILTMSIERFFVVAEEAGIKQALRTAAGSAAVASITYQLVDLDPLQLTFFVYPELLLAVAGLQVLVGRYTGYRLSELVRFREIGKTQ